ncbi:hypothetical protein [Halomonas sp.]|uniref:hypothetical protein n=1 Tax=Halomonas sp. TaxID=1486246 RepID=UPI003D11943E
MTREDGEPRIERAIPDSPRGRLKGSVQEYSEPFEPVGVDDWEVLGLEDDMATRGDGA